MPFRKLLIRTMLYALGATALCGAGAALMGIGDSGWRIVATGVATAVAAGLMLPFSILADKPTARREGLFGMTLVIIEFVGSMGLIWRIFQSVGNWRAEEDVGLTMLFLGLCGLPAVLFLRFSSTKSARIAGHAGVGLAILVFALLMIGTWGGDQWYQKDNWFETAGALAGIGLLGVASLAGVGIEPRHSWRWAGVLASIVGSTMAIVGIWQTVHRGAGIFAVVVSLAAVVAHANVTLLVKLTAGQKWVRIVTIMATIATAGLLDLLALGEDYDFEFPMAGNLAAAAGIIASCGSLALLVLARINRNLDRVPVLSEIRQLTLICPGCKKKQTVPVGESSCAGCGLKLKIQVEEPRCPKCDYLLFMLQSDRCPECGTLIAAAVNAE